MKYRFITFFFLSLSVAGISQQKDSVTKAYYARAEQMLYFNTTKYIDNNVSNIHWLEDDKCWYQAYRPQKKEYVLVDAAKGTRTIVTKDEVDKGEKTNAKSNEVLSPDGTKAAFIKDYNLWVRDVATNKLTQLTTDGVQYFGYATDNAGWKHSDDAILRWSADSKKIATFQQDERKAGDMYLVSTNVGHPKLEAWKYPLPGDSAIFTIQRVIINVDEPKLVRLQMQPDMHRGTLSDDISSSGTFDDVDWSADETELAFVSTSRDHKNEKFRIANYYTGIRTVARFLEQYGQ